MAAAREETNDGAWRLIGYKNQGKNAEELKRERNAVAVELRKSKRDETLFRRRNLPDPEFEDGDDGFDYMNDYMGMGVPTEDVVRRIVESLEMAKSPVPETRLEGIQAIRKMLSFSRWPPVAEMISRGVLPILMACLAPTETQQLQFQAAWAITNIVSGTSAHTWAAVEAGAVPAFVTLLDSPYEDVSDQAIWALANIIGEGAHLRDYCIKAGLIDVLAKYVQPTTSVPFLRNVTWALANLCRNEEPCMAVPIVNQLMALITVLLDYPDTTILTNSLWALSYLMDPSADILQLVIDSGLANKLVPFLDQDNPKVIVPVIRILGNLTTGTDVQAQYVLDAGILAYCPKLLMNPKPKIHQGTVWLLSNVLAGTSNQVQLIIDANVLPLMREHLAVSSFSCRKEAAWAFSNMALTGTPEQVAGMVALNIIVPMCELLTAPDSQIVRVVLNTLKNLLELKTGLPPNLPPVAEQIEACNGLEKLESLQYSANEGIRKAATALIDAHWGSLSAGAAGGMEAPQLTAQPGKFSF